MSIAKQSPTISELTLTKSNWFALNGGGFGNGNNPKSIYDNDGFDIHGYNVDGLDRAGVSYAQYQDPNSKGREGVKLYDSVKAHWAKHNILNMKSMVDRISNSSAMMAKVDEIQALQKKPANASTLARIETLKTELSQFLESQ